MVSSDTALYRCLYTDVDGQVIGLDEVQLLDPIPLDRLETLYAALDGDDPFDAIESAQVLAAWADPRGLAQLDHYLAAGFRSTSEALVPDRFSGEDSVYDRLAEAALVSRLNGNSLDNIRRVI